MSEKPNAADFFQILAQMCRCRLGDPSTYKTPTGYPGSLALCVVDSVQSTGVKYLSVLNVLGRYRAYRRGQGGNPNSDSLGELLRTFAELDSDEAWAECIGNENKTSTRPGAPLKSTAIRLAAETLVGVGIGTCSDLRAAVEHESRYAEVRQAWTGVVGQHSGITFHYVQMLAGVPGVKPDRMILRFVADALGLPRRKVRTDFAAEIVTAAAQELAVSPTALDHAIWQYQRMRR